MEINDSILSEKDKYILDFFNRWHQIVDKILMHKSKKLLCDIIGIDAKGDEMIVLNTAGFFHLPIKNNE